MANLKVSALKDLTGAQGFMLAGGGITATTTLTCSNIIINGEIRGGSTYVVPPQGGNGAKHGNRGARGREGVVVVHEFYG